jgi:hypothetical protein
MTIRTTRPRSYSPEPSNKDDENIDLTKRPLKRRKVSNGSKAGEKDRAVPGGKVSQASGDGTKVSDKYINFLMDKLN